MKFLLYFSAFFLTATAGLNAQIAMRDRPPEKIYIYRIEIENAQGSPEDVGGRVAAVIQSDSLKTECIDFRSLGSASTSSPTRSTTEKMTIALLLNVEMNNAQKEKIKTEVCIGADQCETQFSLGAQKLYQTYLRAEMDDGSTARTPRRREFKDFYLGNETKLPQFSDACVTGSNDDSYRNSASTDAARALLERLGVPLKDVRTFSLVEIRESHLFGFPRK